MLSFEVIFLLSGPLTFADFLPLFICSSLQYSCPLLLDRSSFCRESLWLGWDVYLFATVLQPHQWCRNLSELHVTAPSAGCAMLPSLRLIVDIGPCSHLRRALYISHRHLPWCFPTATSVSCVLRSAALDYYGDRAQIHRARCYFFHFVAPLSLEALWTHCSMLRLHPVTCFEPASHEVFAYGLFLPRPVLIRTSARNRRHADLLPIPEPDSWYCCLKDQRRQIVWEFLVFGAYQSSLSLNSWVLLGSDFSVLYSYGLQRICQLHCINSHDYRHSHRHGSFLCQWQWHWPGKQRTIVVSASFTDLVYCLSFHIWEAVRECFSLQNSWYFASFQVLNQH